MSITSIASSGMHVAALRQDVSASNIARSVIPGAPRQGVAASEQEGGGVTGSVVAAPSDGDGVVTDVVYSLEARNDFQANALVLSRTNEMLGTLLDKTA